MNLLALETATDLCGVALIQEERLTVELTLFRPRAHAENLAVLIRDALRYGNIEARDLEGIAVSMGPGSYTGLRIGTSSAKGLAFAADAALVGVSSLEALSASVAASAAPGDVVCTAFRARRDEVYAAAFRVAASGILEPIAETAALKQDDISMWLGPLASGRVWLAGEGAQTLSCAIARTPSLEVIMADSSVFAPSAAWVARRGLERMKNGLIEDLASFEPFYLKEFVAKEQKRSIFERLSFSGQR